MAASLSSSSSQYFYVSSSPVATAPITISGWAFSSARGEIVQILKRVLGTYQDVRVRFMVSLLEAYHVGNTIHADINSSGPYSTSQYNHTAGVFESTVSRTVYLNGLDWAADHTSVGTSASYNYMYLGARYSAADGSVGLPMNGSLAEVGIWDVVLTMDELISLSKGFAPRRIRPQSLVFYTPLIRNVVELRSGLSVSTSASAPTVSEHPRVY